MMKCLLEVVWHIICQLADTVEGCVADLWVEVLQVLNDRWNHCADLFHLVYILTYL